MVKSHILILFTLVGDINLNSGPVKVIGNNNMWDDLLFHNCNLFIDRPEN